MVDASARVAMESGRDADRVHDGRSHPSDDDDPQAHRRRRLILILLGASWLAILVQILVVAHYKRHDGGYWRAAELQESGLVLVHFVIGALLVLRAPALGAGFLTFTAVGLTGMFGAIAAYFGVVDVIDGRHHLGDQLVLTTAVLTFAGNAWLLVSVLRYARAIWNFRRIGSLALGFALALFGMGILARLVP